ncbi:carbonic anhydrase [Sandaracinus amylolyticus]|nr:carbonic anhydrase [Sandaracinus amylolyticus]
MKKLVHGVHRFHSEVFASQRDLFLRLGGGQSPQALFVTCSDSRIDPNLLTQTQPGELFILRNAGNIVPAWGTHGAEAATIEFAIAGLGIEHIVVCGHSHCGAMKALITPGSVDRMPAMREWLTHAAATGQVVDECYADRDPEERLNVAIQENVLAQLTNLRTHPAVAARLATGKLHLHAWVYKITSGEVFAYDQDAGQFRVLGGEAPAMDQPRRSLDGALLADARDGGSR